MSSTLTVSLQWSDCVFKAVTLCLNFEQENISNSLCERFQKETE